VVYWVGGQGGQGGVGSGGGGRGWPKRYDFGMGWWGRGIGGLPFTPKFVIRKSMTIAYIKDLVTT
jgi:hypothetical protein